MRTAETLYRYRAGTLQPLCAGRSIGLDSIADPRGPVGGDLERRRRRRHGVRAERPVLAPCDRSGAPRARGDRAARAARRQHPDRDEPRPQAVPRLARSPPRQTWTSRPTPVSALLVDRSGAVWIGHPGRARPSRRQRRQALRRGGRHAALRNQGAPAGQGRQHLVRHRRRWRRADSRRPGRDTDDSERVSRRIACARCTRIAKAVSGSGRSRPARSGCATARPRRSAGIRACQGTSCGRCCRIGPAASSSVSMATASPSARRTAPSPPIRRSIGCATPAFAPCTTTARAAC